MYRIPKSFESGLDSLESQHLAQFFHLDSNIRKRLTFFTIAANVC